MALAELFQRFGIAIAIGFLVGVERGWKQRTEAEGGRTAGLRTFTLIGLLGGVAGALGRLYGVEAFAAMALVFGAVFSAFKYREHVAEQDFSVTGVIAGLLTFALGAYVLAGDMQAGAAAGVVVVCVLAFKTALHEWLRGLTWPEVRSALLILAMTLVALPLLPDQPIDRFGAVNPRELWLLTITIAGASFAGYWALRALGPQAGMMLGAAAGAMASSTVATLELARRVKGSGLPPSDAGAAALLASIVMLARVTVLCALFAAPALHRVAPPIAAAAAATGLIGLILYFREKPPTDRDGYARIQSPLDIRSVLRFGAILAAITIGARLTAHWYGGAGMLTFAGFAGLADVDAVTLVVGGMIRAGQSPRLGADAILLAVAVDTLSKSAIAFWAGGRQFGAYFAVGSAVSIAAGAAVWLLV